MVYKLGKIIGKGSDGIIYELLENDKNIDKVIKFIQGEIYGIKNYLEYYILFQLDKRYISGAINVEIEEDGLIKIIQKKADMDLKDYIYKHKPTQLEKKELMIQLIDGLEYLHSFNILHGDIKPTNILVYSCDNQNKKKSFTCKYADFNLSMIHCSDSKLTKKLYTVTYRAPEIENKKVSLKSDIWALGCTFFEIYYGYSYFNFRKDRKFYHLKSCEENLPENQLFNNLISNMIQDDIFKRYDIRNIKNHLYFNGVIKKDKVLKKIKMSQNELKCQLEKNYEKFSIKSRKDKKMFLSKFGTKTRTPIHKNYQKIENMITYQNFDFDLFTVFERNVEKDNK